MIFSILKEGVEKNIIRNDLNLDITTNIILSTFRGTIVAIQLYDNVNEELIMNYHKEIFKMLTT